MFNNVSAVLEKAEKFFRIDFSYLLREGGWLFVAKLLVTLTAFGLSIIYANFLSKEIYGSYRYILSVISILGFLSLPGLGTAITRSVAQGKLKTYLTGLKSRFFASFAITVISASLSLYFLLNGDNALGYGFLLAGILAPFAEGTGSFLSYFDGTGQFKRKSIWNVTIQITRSFAIAGTILLLTRAELSYTTSLLLLISANFLVLGVLQIFLTLKTLKEIPKGAVLDAEANRYGIHLTAMNIPSTIATYLDGILLFAFLGPVSLAIYSFALAPSEQLKGLLKVTDTLAFPRFSKNDKGMKDDLVRKVLISILFIVPILAAYYFIAPYFFSFFFPQYLDSISPSQVLAFSLLGFPAVFFLSALKAEKRTKTLYIYNTIFPVLEIALLISLIPFWGLWGAVIARTAARLSNLFILGALFKSKI